MRMASLPFTSAALMTVLRCWSCCCSLVLMSMLLTVKSGHLCTLQQPAVTFILLEFSSCSKFDKRHYSFSILKIRFPKNESFTVYSFSYSVFLIASYASPSSGDAYSDQQLSPNFELKFIVYQHVAI